MVLLKLANIGFPPEVLAVDKGNSCIGFVSWSVILMRIKSSLMLLTRPDGCCLLLLRLILLIDVSL